MADRQPTYTVTELTDAIAGALATAFPGEVWVTGEIRDITRPASGHVFFSLIDVDATVTGAAMLPVTLFATDKMAVNRILSRSGAIRMTDGVQVRIRGRVTVYPSRGTVQLRMTGIDSEYTLGRLESERAALLLALRAEGLIEANARRPTHVVPLRIGLVTSVGSAAHADFMDEILRSGFGFYVIVAHARVQGVGAAGTIIKAIDALQARALDVIAIVRGGGARTDLAAFDDERLVRAVATCPVQVWTGIGHEIDTSATDLVAARALKSPTACARELVGVVERFLVRLDRVGADLIAGATRRLGGAEHAVELGAGSLTGTTGAGLSRARAVIDAGVRRLDGGVAAVLARESTHHDAVTARLGRDGRRVVDNSTRSVIRHAEEVGSRSRRAVTASERRLAHAVDVVRATDPARVLGRGWSVTRGADGRLVRSPEDVTPGDVLATTTAGGPIHSVVSDATMGTTRGVSHG